MQKFIWTAATVLCGLGVIPAQTLSAESVLIETEYGNMTVKFYEETPVHKSAFLKLVKTHFFDSLLFHRVINSFMIQGGDPLSKTAKPGDSLGHGDLGYTLPAEIRPGLIHKKGALCAARESDDINPTFASSASQFYIVMGKPRSGPDLLKYETRINKALTANAPRLALMSPQGKALNARLEQLQKENKTDSASQVKEQLDALMRRYSQNTPAYKFSARQTEVYTTLGGTPHLDNTYTVFGEVVNGLEVIDKIAAVNTDKRDRPLKDIRMKMSVIKQ